MSDRVPPFERFGETLLAPSLIRLFGRVFTGLTIEREIAADAARQSYPANQLSQILNDENSGWRVSMASASRVIISKWLPRQCSWSTDPAST